MLDTVADYVLEHGIGGLAMRPLATAVGGSHGTLLDHFGSKENLVTEGGELLRQRLMDSTGLIGPPESIDGLATWWRGTTTPQHLAI